MRENVAAVRRLTTDDRPLTTECEPLTTVGLLPFPPSFCILHSAFTVAGEAALPLPAEGGGLVAVVEPES
jgi:hypothetical protein